MTEVRLDQEKTATDNAEEKKKLLEKLVSMEISYETLTLKYQKSTRALMLTPKGMKEDETKGIISVDQEKSSKKLSDEKEDTDE